VRILWHSNSNWSPTGYGQQTQQVTTRMRDAGHDVAISAFWGLGGSSLDWDGMRVYPSDEDWGNTWLVAYTHHHGQGDIQSVQVITLMDVWVLTAPLLNTLNLASWVPVDHDPLPPRVKDYFVRTGAVPIAMSKFGARKLADAGLEPLYVPHGIDTDTYRPIPQAEARAVLGIPEDAFVVGMVAANKGNAPPRKAFPQVFEAFARFQRQHKDAILYLHSMKQAGANGLDLIALARVMGIPPEAIRFTPEFELHMGVEAGKMPWVYSNMDVLCSPSYGEGFGIPIIEAQSCGVPVVVGDNSAMPELVGHGWKVGGFPWYDTSQGAYFQAPSVAEITDALEHAYEDRGGGSQVARDFALQYDATTVFEKQWTPVLAELERRMLAKKEMPAVTLSGPNREARRKARRTKAA